jgi:TonB family protein
MRKLALITAIALFTLPLMLAEVDPAAVKSFEAAERQANIFCDDASPFQMEVDFDAQMLVPVQGHMTLRWQSKDRWWRKITMGSYAEIDIKNGERQFTSRNAAFTPVRIKQLVHMLSVSEGSERSEIKKLKQKKQQGVTIFCMQLRERAKGSDLHELCFNPASNELLSDEWKTTPDGKSSSEYTEYFEFRGHRYPREIQHFENEIKAVIAHVVNLSTVPFDESLLVPPQGAIERRQCPGIQHAVAVKTPEPSYPESASENRLMGDTTVSMTVLADGSVGEIQLIGSGGRSMDDMTLKTLQSWKFRPAMCGAEPVVSDIEVIVSFRLR